MGEYMSTEERPASAMLVVRRITLRPVVLLSVLRTYHGIPERELMELSMISQVHTEIQSK